MLHFYYTISIYCIIGGVKLMDDIIITTRAIAKELDVTTQTIYRWIKKGMPFIQLANGRRGYRMKDINEWMLGGYNDKKI